MSGVRRLLYTYKEAAEACGVGKRTIERAVGEGELIAVNAPGTCGGKGRRIPVAELERWLDEQLEQAKRAG